MKEATYIPGIALALLLGGCVLSGKQQPKASAVPPPPKSPAAAPASTASTPQAPLSILQTVAELPPPQPISADALPTLKPVEEPVESQPVARPPVRRGPVAGPPRADATPAVPAQPAPAPTAQEEAVRPPITEILPPAEVKRLQESVEARKRDIKRVLDQTDPKRLNPAQLDLEARIRTLVQQSDEAGTRNDWRQADALAGQALTLVRELQGGR
jgi:hypothetical protein